MKPEAAELIRAAPEYLGVPYSTLDCQAFVEACLKDIGIRKNLAGSNTWYRLVRKNGWVGTPAECRKKYGRIPKGAFLFILKQDGKEPEQYQDDGIGNASHIGIYTGETAEEMLAACEKYQEMNADEKAVFRKRVSFGDGAIHSSSTRKCVATSTFSGQSISGGWNRIGIWDELNYNTEPEEDGGEKMTAKVWADTGSTVNLRSGPDIDYPLVDRIPIGETVEILDETADWAKVKYKDKQGWMMKGFLKTDGAEDPETVTVSRKELETIWGQIGAMLGK